MESFLFSTFPHRIYKYLIINQLQSTLKENEKILKGKFTKLSQYHLKPIPLHQN